MSDVKTGVVRGKDKMVVNTDVELLGRIITTECKKKNLKIGFREKTGSQYKVSVRPIEVDRQRICVIRISYTLS